MNQRHPIQLKLMPVATLQQAAAVQDTWYTVLDTTYNVEVYRCTIVMQTLAEDLQMRLTIDGTTYSGTQAAAVAGTQYYPTITGGSDAITLSTTLYLLHHYAPLKARSFKMEIRKTSNNGANRLDGYCRYAKF